MTTTYNGWTNYATWRVNLEVFDGLNPHDMGWTADCAYDLSQELQGYAEEIVCDGCAEGLAHDYALAFLSDVNWQEIAEHMVEDYAEA